jgi:hypothetical protein
VAQGGEETRLLIEAGEPLRVAGERLGEELERHLASQSQVGGAVHLPHPARADLLGDPVMAQRPADQGACLPLAVHRRRRRSAASIEAEEEKESGAGAAGKISGR